MVKKLVALGCSATLVVGSLFIGKDKEAATADVGVGADAKITTLSQFSNVLQTFAPRMSFNADSVFMRAADLADDATAYTSATFYLETQGNASTTWQGISSVMSVDKKMTCYYTPTASYYDIQVDVREMVRGFEYEWDNSESWTTLDMELYMDANRKLLRFNDIQLTDNMKKYSLYNKWLDIRDLSWVESQFLALGKSGLSQMLLFDECLQAFTGEGFAKDGDTYELGEVDATALCVQLARLLKVNGTQEQVEDPSFTVDLSDEVAPALSLDYAIQGEAKATEMDTSGKTTEYTLTYSAAERTSFTVRHIDNTVVRFPANAEIYDFAKMKAQLGI